MLVALSLLLLSAAETGAPAERELDLVEVSLETDRLATESLELMLERERRLISVSTRVRQASAALCRGEHAPILGVQLIRAPDLPAALIGPAARQHRLDDRLRVIWTLPGSPAERAGVQPGDAVVSLDGRGVEVESDLMEARAPAGATSLDFVPGCYFEPALSFGGPGASVNRFERRIVVTSGLLRQVESDDQLAFIIAHEIGHALLRHVGGSRPDKEASADYFAAYLAARAHFDPAAGAEYFSRFTAHNPGALVTSTHPSSPERSLAVLRAVREIQEKRRAGLDLIPEGFE